MSFHPKNVNRLFPGEVAVSLYLMKPGSANVTPKIRISEIIAERSESFCRIETSQVGDFHTPRVGFRVGGAAGLVGARIENLILP